MAVNIKVIVFGGVAALYGIWVPTTWCFPRRPQFLILVKVFFGVLNF